MTAAVQERGGQVLPPFQPQVERPQSQPQPLIHRMKENVIWAWNATYEKLEAAGSRLKILLQKVVEAIRTFFGPKLEAAKQVILDLYDRITSKKAAAPAPVVTPPAAVAPPQEQQRIEPPVLVKKAVEEPQPALAAAPEQQFFVPPPIELPAPPPEEPRVQMPIEVPVVIEETLPANVAPPAVPPGIPAVVPPGPTEPPQQVGVFRVLSRWFW